MSKVTAQYWLRVQRRVSDQAPAVRAAVLRAFELLRNGLDDTQIERLIRKGDLDTLLATFFSDARLDTAFARAARTMQDIVAKSVRSYAADLPAGGKINGRVAVAFNVLNERDIDAIRTLDTKVIQALKTDVVDTVRELSEWGLRVGANPRETAIYLRDVVGMGPRQLDAVLNFRGMLESGDRTALSRALRDKRFDSVLERALGQGGTGLTTTQIDRYVQVYERNMVAFNAETISRTATIDSVKLGQYLSWADAVDKGIVDGDKLMKRWVGVKDDRERPEHLAMEGDTVAWDEPFSNGQMLPGDTEYNCRCVPFYFMSR